IRSSGSRTRIQSPRAEAASSFRTSSTMLTRGRWSTRAPWRAATSGDSSVLARSMTRISSVQATDARQSPKRSASLWHTTQAVMEGGSMLSPRLRSIMLSVHPQRLADVALDRSQGGSRQLSQEGSQTRPPGHDLEVNPFERCRGRQGGLVLECRAAAQVRPVDIEHKVLAVPPLHLLILPDVPANRIQPLKPVLQKESVPIPWPLLVDVGGAPLTGYGRGEEHERCGGSEALNQQPPSFGGQMLRNLETEGEVVALLQS